VIFFEEALKIIKQKPKRYSYVKYVERKLKKKKKFAEMNVIFGS
jgi:hypothetical protein